MNNLYKTLLFIFAMTFCMEINAEDKQCRKFTAQQVFSLKQAYRYGEPFDLGYTLAAITMQESFVGNYIVRINEKDKPNGSYGITHINLKTAMWLENEKSIWEAKQIIVPTLLIDDYYSFDLSVKLLLHNQKKTESWKELWASYNGSGEDAKNYSEKIANHINEFKRCGVPVSKIEIPKEFK